MYCKRERFKNQIKLDIAVSHKIADLTISCWNRLKPSIQNKNYKRRKIIKLSISKKSCIAILIDFYFHFNLNCFLFLFC